MPPIRRSQDEARYDSSGFLEMLLCGGILMSDAITLADLNECDRDLLPPVAAVRQGFLFIAC
jgi:hypothetical protein